MRHKMQISGVKKSTNNKNLVPEYKIKSTKTVRKAYEAP